MNRLRSIKLHHPGAGRDSHDNPGCCNSKGRKDSVGTIESPTVLVIVGSTTPPRSKHRITPPVMKIRHSQLGGSCAGAATVPYSKKREKGPARRRDDPLAPPFLAPWVAR